MRFFKVTLLLVALLVLLVPATATATPDGEYIATATGWVDLCPENTNGGPVRVDIQAKGGDCTLYFQSEGRSDRIWPDDSLGDSVAEYAAYQDQPRPFYTAGDGINRVYIDLTDGATSVVITWEMQ